MQRKIKLNGKIKDIDISDGKGDYPFGMNGAGGMTFYIDGERFSDNCYCENENMLDGNVNFAHERTTRNCSWYEEFKIKDLRYTELTKIHRLDHKDIKDYPRGRRIDNILFGLKYFAIKRMCSGYRFGRELTYRDFCITFNGDKLVVYQSSHNGYLSPDYLILNKKHKDFRRIICSIRRSICDYFDI